MSVFRIYVEKKPDYAVKAKELLGDIKGYLGIKSVDRVRYLIRYDVENISDETYEILDYKTEPTLRTQQAVDEDKQLSIYYWAAEETMGLKISKLSLLMLDHDKKIETFRSRENIPHVIEAIDKTAYEMLTETEFKPKMNKYCKSCDHLNSCPLKEEILKNDALISMKKF